MRQPFPVLLFTLCVVVSFTSAGEMEIFLIAYYDFIAMYLFTGIKQRFPRLPNLLTFFFQGLKEANKTETTPPPLPTPFLIGLQEGAASEIESTTLPPILPNVLNSYYNMEGETLSSSIALPYSGVDGQRRVGKYGPIIQILGSSFMFNEILEIVYFRFVRR